MPKRLKNIKKRIFFTVFLSIAVISVLSPPIQKYPVDNGLIQVPTAEPIAQPPADIPIKIDEVSDFASFPGSGTYHDPYIISGYEIMSSSTYGTAALSFISVSEYVVVSNCTFITNGTTELAAIYMDNSSLISIVNCKVDVINKLEGGFGIKMRNSSDIQIVGCEISNVYHMSSVEIFTDCSNVLVKSNIIKGCWNAVASGMIVGGGNCTNLTIIGNHITQCNYGINFRDVIHTTIRDNYIAKMGNEYGLDTNYINTENCTDVSLIDNTIIKRFLNMDITLTDVAAPHKEILLVAEPIDGFGPFTYQWDFDDNSTIETTKSVKHVYSAAGSYYITVTATDIDGETVTTGYQIEIIEEVDENKVPGFPFGAFLTISILGIAIIWKKSIKNHN